MKTTGTNRLTRVVIAMSCVAVLLTSSGCITAIENTIDPDPLMPPQAKRPGTEADETLENIGRVAVVIFAYALIRPEVPFCPD